MDEKIYQLVLSLDLEITPEAFVSAWNETVETSSVGKAYLPPTERAQFDLTVLGVLLTIATSVSSRALYDCIIAVIKHLDAKKATQGTPVHKRIHIREEKTLDGTQRFVVNLDEN